jgi:hypothetical protein
MSDRQLRELERRWMETGSPEDRKVYAKARKRAGLENLPREVIRHFVRDVQHGVCNSVGKISLPKDRQNLVLASCSVELWPRLGAEGHGYHRTMKKTVFYTEDPEEVTCKRCLKVYNKLPEGVRRRMHYAPGSKCAPRDELRERVVVPVCGRNDSDRFMESFSHSMREVNCPACRRIMERGRRRPRQPRSKVFA